MADQPDALLRFQPLQSAVDQSFWADFTKLKLHDLKLSEDVISIKARYAASSISELPSPVQLDSLSLHPADSASQTRVSIDGELLNFNTLDGFKNAPHASLLRSAAAKTWQAIKSGKAEEDPSLFCRFLLLSHAELKSYRYYYWFAFPALKPPQPFTARPGRSLSEAYGLDLSQRIAGATEKWLAEQQQIPAFWLLDCSAGAAILQPLSAWQSVKEKSPLLAAVDPSNASGNPSWIVRNLLLLAAAKWRLRSVTIVSFRSRGGRLSPDSSLVFEVTLPEIPIGWLEDANFVPEAVGWEANPKQKLGPRVADLGASLDPARLAESAADLNVRLMKWRAAPALDIDRLSTAKCLLLGAGTLGCAVARTLLGWGVRNITLLDNSRVSFSNPVRQSLYEFGDCLDGGRPKAAAAAERLRAVFPKVNALSVELNIPMPGHPLSDVEIQEAERSAARLEALIEAHDVVFLLMDTRESRWLPTLLCAVHDKIAINAALGFDSFLVMRHGAAPLEEGEGSSKRLGCYFCNDIVAPLDSTLDRTLDQQCTVARPGLAPIAGALAVELMAAVLQHPSGVGAPSTGPAPETEAALGGAPHMIRGQLSGFSQMCLTGQAFRQCTACSGTVVAQYRKEGWFWLLQALQDPKKLEDLTGLTDLMKSTALDAVDVDGFGDLDSEGDDEFVTL